MSEAWGSFRSHKPIRKSITDYTPWFSMVFTYPRSSKPELVCVCVFSSGDPRPPPSSFCQQCACLTMSAKGTWRVWNLADICRALSFSLHHHAKITRSWIHTTVSVARELSSHLVTKQQHGMKAFAALPEKYAATHT